MVDVGTSYADLGATITGPGGDVNLGIHYIVDNVEMDVVQIDTSVPGDHTIEYRATDADGNQGHAIRIVHVVATESPPAPAPEGGGSASTTTPESASSSSTPATATTTP